jgi:hypothetical protein
MECTGCSSVKSAQRHWVSGRSWIARSGRPCATARRFRRSSCDLTSHDEQQASPSARCARAPLPHSSVAVAPHPGSYPNVQTELLGRLSAKFADR